MLFGGDFHPSQHSPRSALPRSSPRRDRNHEGGPSSRGSLPCATGSKVWRLEDLPWEVATDKEDERPGTIPRWVSLGLTVKPLFRLSTHTVRIPNSSLLRYCDTLQFRVVVLRYLTVPCCRTAIPYSSLLSYCNTLQRSVDPRQNWLERYSAPSIPSKLVRAILCSLDLLIKMVGARQCSIRTF